MSDAGALQFYYTSCRKGLSGYAGFQTRAESKGLQDDERKELEGKSLYQPPRDLPHEPDIDIIAQQFPKAFRVVRLSSGRVAIIRAVYTGQDYSGRWGNYFAHGLVLDKAFDNQWPIDTYSWPGWVERLSESEDKLDPEPLSIIPLSKLSGGSDFSFQELKIFLGESKSRPGVFARMLDAVLRRASDERRIVIREQSELDAVYWIACIQKAFPAKCQGELSSSTFHFDPRSSLAVNATIGETDFLFDEGERHYQFYVFDFVSDQHSEIRGEPSEYAQTISQWMVSDPKRMEDLHKFATLFNYIKVGPKLINILWLYKLESGDGVRLTKQQLHAILKFVTAYARENAFERVLNSVGDVTRHLDAAAPPDAWNLIIRFLMDVAASTGEAVHCKYVCKAWVGAFDHFVVKEKRAESIVAEIREDIEKKIKHISDTMTECFLADNHMDWLLASLSGMSDKNIRIIMAEVMRSTRKLRGEPTYQSFEIFSLIEAFLCSNPKRLEELQWAFEPYRCDLDGLTAIVHHIVKVLEQDVLKAISAGDTRDFAYRSVGRSLASVLRPQDRNLRFDLINRLKKDGQMTRLLVGEWECAIDLAIDKISAHEKYEKAVLEDASSFAAHVRDEMAAKLLKMLPLCGQQLQALKWIHSKRYVSLPDDTTLSVLELASKTLSFSPEDHQSKILANLISGEISARNLTLPTDRLELRLAAQRVLSGPNGLDGLSDTLKNTDASSYKEFMEEVFPKFFRGEVTPEAYGRVLFTLAVDTHKRLFKEFYVRFLKEKRKKKRFNKKDFAETAFWLRLRQSDDTSPRLWRLRKTVLGTMAARFGYMDKKTRSKVDTLLKGSEAFREPNFRQSLQKFLNNADELYASSPSRVLGRIFDRIFGRA